MLYITQILSISKKCFLNNTKFTFEKKKKKIEAKKKRRKRSQISKFREIETHTFLFYLNYLKLFLFDKLIYIHKNYILLN